MTFEAKQRGWWRPAVAFGVLVVVALVGAAIKSSISIADVGIGAAMVAALALLVWALSRKLASMRLTFDGWNVTFKPAFGRVRTFDPREITWIRFGTRRGVSSYSYRLGDQGLLRTQSLPISMFPDPEAERQFLIRLAAVDPERLDADERMSQALVGWRDELSKTGADPASALPRS